MRKNSNAVPDDRTGERLPAGPPRRSPIRQMLSWGALVLIAAGWFIFLRPAELGGPVGYILINGDSMLPNLRTGDMVLVRPTERYSPGDVVVYRVPEGNLGAGVKIIHRIIGGDERSGFVVQGDNKPHKDPWKPLPSDVVGTLWVQVPSVGHLLWLLRTRTGLALVAAFLATWIVMGDKPRARRTQWRAVR